MAVGQPRAFFLFFVLYFAEFVLGGVVFIITTWAFLFFLSPSLLIDAVDDTETMSSPRGRMKTIKTKKKKRSPWEVAPVVNVDSVTQNGVALVMIDDSRLCFGYLPSEELDPTVCLNSLLYRPG